MRKSEYHFQISVHRLKFHFGISKNFGAFAIRKSDWKSLYSILSNYKFDRTRVFEVPKWHFKQVILINYFINTFTAFSSIFTMAMLPWGNVVGIMVVLGTQFNYQQLFTQYFLYLVLIRLLHNLIKMNRIIKIIVS